MFPNVKFCAEVSSIVDVRAIRLHAISFFPRGNETAGAREQTNYPDFTLCYMKMVSTDISPQCQGV